MIDGSNFSYFDALLGWVLVACGVGIVGGAQVAVEESSATTASTQPSPVHSPVLKRATLETSVSLETRNGVRHAPFTRVLQRFVDEKGDVNYEALKAQADSTLLPYLQTLAAARLEPLDRDARLALWINAYNAYTLKLIIDHYPVTSIQNIDGPTEGGTPFQRPIGRVADTMRTLDEIEHDIIRERFDEPRIHFALVCAAKSCPRLRREAYTGPRLEEQLADQARQFLHSDRRNRIPAGDGTISLSRILKWYGSDFGPTPRAIQQALAPHFEGTVRDSLANGAYEIRFRPYDWTLNDQSLQWREEPVETGS